MRALILKQLISGKNIKNPCKNKSLLMFYICYNGMEECYIQNSCTLYVPKCGYTRSHDINAFTNVYSLHYYLIVGV